MSPKQAAKEHPRHDDFVSSLGLWWKECHIARVSRDSDAVTPQYSFLRSTANLQHI
jgi:hypothetical protein